MGFYSTSPVGDINVSTRPSNHPSGKGKGGKNPKKGGGGPSPNAGLLSWWDMGEASGLNRVDSKGSNDYVDVNTVGTMAGQEGEGLAANLQSSGSKRFQIAAGHGLGLNDHDVLSFCGWVRPEVSFIPHYFVHQGTDYQTATALGWSIRRNSTTLSLRVGAATGARTECDFGTLANVTWGFIFGYINWTTEECGASLNNGTITTASLSGKTKNTNSYIQYCNFAQPSYYGRFGMQSAGIWDKQLDPAVVTTLYNGGTALRYADL